MKKNLVIVLALLFSFCVFSSDINVFFDNTHSQSSGNSDWSIHGGYSDLADLLRHNDFNVIDRDITLDNISKDIDILVIPEPNDPFSKNEIKEIVRFTKDGGSLLIIGNHSGADRNGNGYDAVLSLNEFVFHFGFLFNTGHTTDVPLLMTEHPICNNVDVIGSFAGTTITPVLSNVRPVLLTKNNNPFMVESTLGKGKILALCDTAMFDDGTGTEGKHLHNVFNSIMYSNRQFAMNIFNYLAKKPLKILKKKKPYNRITKGMITIDISHANVGADTTEDFSRHLKDWGYTPYYNRERFTNQVIKNSSLIIIYEPSINLNEQEISLLKKNSIPILFVEVSSFNSLNREHTNGLIERLSDNNLSSINDQVLDEKNAIDGSPWTFTAKNDHGDVIVFSTCSIRSSKECKILLRSSEAAYSTLSPKEKSSQVLIAYHPASKIAAAGFQLFSNYNFKDSEYYADSYKNVLHNTENFIQYLVNQLRSN
ncbi:MAG: hypothetical protein C0601_04210 [Candidatus Muiribacterium halophilum]|uniref:Uncharacterized protein n=1 Tax=Muiribacterium halophilum TaxID=2053465 RepID=A0A2N5ZIX8_MUIH1|nr:MAG: hypothetical protein C0601_04210 [Candidatus Muirbacterium halophilum]